MERNIETDAHPSLWLRLSHCCKTFTWRKQLGRSFLNIYQHEQNHMNPQNLRWLLLASMASWCWHLTAQRPRRKYQCEGCILARFLHIYNLIAPGAEPVLEPLVAQCHSPTILLSQQVQTLSYGQKNVPDSCTGTALLYPPGMSGSKLSPPHPVASVGWWPPLSHISLQPTATLI